MTDPYHPEQHDRPELFGSVGEEHPDEPALPAVSAGAAQNAGGESGTGDERVDEAMAQLRALAGKPAAERVAEYEAVHRTLQDTLATVDDV